MGSQPDPANQVIAVPKGRGALQGIGEKFSPDFYTGTGNFAVPIAVPPGRNSFQPQLSLAYSTGNGNGPFGQLHSGLAERWSSRVGPTLPLRNPMLITATLRARSFWQKSSSLTMVPSGARANCLYRQENGRILSLTIGQDLRFGHFGAARKSMC